MAGNELCRGAGEQAIDHDRIRPKNERWEMRLVKTSSRSMKWRSWGLSCNIYERESRNPSNCNTRKKLRVRKNYLSKAPKDSSRVGEVLGELLAAPSENEPILQTPKGETPFCEKWPHVGPACVDPAF